MDVYRVPKSTQAIGVAGLLCFAFMVCLVISLPGAESWQGRAISAGFFAWLAYSTVLTVPFRITVHDNGPVEFRSILRKRVVLPGEVNYVQDSAWLPSFIYVGCDGGTIKLYKNARNIRDLISKLRALNPDAELKGRLRQSH